MVTTEFILTVSFPMPINHIQTLTGLFITLVYCTCSSALENTVDMSYLLKTKTNNIISCLPYFNDKVCVLLYGSQRPSVMNPCWSLLWYSPLYPVIQTHRSANCSLKHLRVSCPPSLLCELFYLHELENVFLCLVDFQPLKKRAWRLVTIPGF